MKKKFIVITLFFCLIFLIGNAPPPWWACEKKQEGEPCTPFSYGCSLKEGKCVLWNNCQDDPQTNINECLVCQENRFE